MKYRSVAKLCPQLLENSYYKYKNRNNKMLYKEKFLVKKDKRVKGNVMISSRSVIALFKDVDSAADALDAVRAGGFESHEYEILTRNSIS